MCPAAAIECALADVFFVDDSDGHVAVAATFGWAAVRFRDARQPAGAGQMSLAAGPMLCW
jgi:hypothetical protein